MQQGPGSRHQDPRGFVLALVSSTFHHTASHSGHLDWHSAEELTTHRVRCQTVMLIETLNLSAAASSEVHDWAL